MSRFRLSFPPGELIGGRYRVVQRFEGGMSEVYQCKDEGDNDRFVALKTLKPHLIDDALQRQRFANELELWIGLGKHPNIVYCSGIFILDKGNVPFMLLEWVSNERGRKPDLRGWMEYGKLDLRLVLGVGIDVCSGMIHANKVYENSGGIAHLDLKPDNILISPRSIAKITDFGMGRVINLKSDSSVYTGKGTANYMAPEQWRQKGIQNTTTDVYSFGCMLFELLTGKPPFVGGLLELQQGHEEKEPDYALLPDYLVPLVSRCIAKKQDDRYQDFIAVYTDLREVYVHELDASPQFRTATENFDIQDYSNRALTYIKLNNYEKALEDLEAALKINPNDMYLIAYKGFTHSHLDDHEQAIQFLTIAKSAFPKDPQINYLLGLAYMRQENYEEMFKALAIVCEVDPTFVEAFYHRGIALAHMERTREAIRDMTYAIKIRPDVPDLYYFRGMLYTEEKDYASALNDYTYVLKLRPGFISAYSQRAYLNVRHFGRLAEALEDLKIHNDYNPDDAHTQAQEGRVYMLLKTDDEAIRCFSNAIRLDDRQAEYYCERGQAYTNLQYYDKAIQDYEKAMEVDPKLGIPYSLRGIVHNQRGDYEKAMEDFTQAARLDPDDVTHIRGRSILYADTHRYEQGVEEITKVIIRVPNEKLAYFVRAIFYEKLEAYERAMEDLEYVIKIAPEFIPAYIGRGNVHLKMEKYNAALRDFRGVVQRNPRNYAGLIGLGQVYEKEGDLRLALRHYEKAAELGSPEAGYYYNKLAKTLNHPSLDYDPLGRVWSAFLGAENFGELQRAVRELPYMVEDYFIGTLQEAVIITRNPRRVSHLRRNLQFLKRLAKQYRKY